MSQNQFLTSGESISLAPWYTAHEACRVQLWNNILFTFFLFPIFSEYLVNPTELSFCKYIQIGTWLDWFGMFGAQCPIVICNCPSFIIYLGWTPQVSLICEYRTDYASMNASICFCSGCALELTDSPKSFVIIIILLSWLLLLRWSLFSCVGTYLVFLCG
jgi:hypothetical protein